MYSNVVYASWLNATNGLSESMTEFVAILSSDLPPLPPPPPVHAPATTATASAAAITRPRLISASLCSSRQRGFVDRKGSGVGVDGCHDAEGDRREVLAVAERKVEHDRHAQRREPVLEHVFHRPASHPRIRRAPRFAPDHLADHDGGHVVELPRVSALGADALAAV